MRNNRYLESIRDYLESKKEEEEEVQDVEETEEPQVESDN